MSISTSGGRPFGSTSPNPKTPNWQAVQTGGPAIGTGGHPRSMRTLDDAVGGSKAALKRRAARAALGITNINKATDAQIAQARAKGLLPTHQQVASKVAAQRKQKGPRPVPIVGGGFRKIGRKSGAVAPPGSSQTMSTPTSMSGSKPLY